MASFRCYYASSQGHKQFSWFKKVGRDAAWLWFGEGQQHWKTHFIQENKNISSKEKQWSNLNKLTEHKLGNSWCKRTEMGFSITSGILFIQHLYHCKQLITFSSPIQVLAQGNLVESLWNFSLHLRDAFPWSEGSTWLQSKNNSSALFYLFTSWS